MSSPLHRGTGTIKDGVLYRREHPQAPGYAGEVKHITGKGVFARFVTPSDRNPKWTPSRDVPSAIMAVEKRLSDAILRAVRAEALQRAALRKYPIPCPTCAAQPGQPCRTASGASTNPHAARRVTKG